MKYLQFILVALCILTAFAGAAVSQPKAGYAYAAQRALIPPDLGKVYLGMPLKEFAAEIDITAAEAGDRFETISLEIPFGKGSVESLTVSVNGLTEADRESLFFDETTTKRSGSGEEYETNVKRLRVGKLAERGFVSAMYVTFKKSFDQKAWVMRTYGNKGEVRKPDDPYHFSDIQWTKKTADGLLWLIRSLHEGDSRTLQLLGRIPGTEWGLDGVN